MRRRLTIAAVVLVLLAVVGVLAWNLADLPPLGFVLRYGYPSPMRPTGRTMEIEGVEFVEISPGYFQMGSHYLCDEGDLVGRICAALGLPWGRPPEHGDECPVHWVEFESGFWIAATEVTNAQYERFSRDHKRSSSSIYEHGPLVEVSWLQAKEYCDWLAERAGRPIRLPSEPEWECACRAGSGGDSLFGDGDERLSAYAWFGENSESWALPVGAKRPNRWGLFDLHGNVWEWCEDAEYAYTSCPSTGSAKPNGGTEHGPVLRESIIRGGSFGSPPENCRSACRNTWHHTEGSDFIGFRPAFTLPPEDDD